MEPNSASILVTGLATLVKKVSGMRGPIPLQALNKN